jgi:hypothetical protein
MRRIFLVMIDRNIGPYKILWLGGIDVYKFLWVAVYQGEPGALYMARYILLLLHRAGQLRATL